MPVQLRDPALLSQTEAPSAPPRRRKRWPYFVLLFLLLPVLGLVLRLALQGEGGFVWERGTKNSQESLPDWIEENLIPVDGVSRRGEKLEGLTGIVVHYVANPGTTARQNRAWYLNPESEVSSHFLIGLEGEVLLCVPLDEKSSASNEANATTLSIELCHPDETGEFTPASEESLVHLLAYLCRRFDLSVDSIIRHYDVTGKICPKYYVEHEDAYLAMKDRVRAALAKEGDS